VPPRVGGVLARRAVGEWRLLTNAMHCGIMRVHNCKCKKWIGGVVVEVEMWGGGEEGKGLEEGWERSNRGRGAERSGEERRGEREGSRRWD